MVSCCVATRNACTLLGVTDSDEAAVGARVVALRGQRSQKSVADEMRSAGWKWSQATVWSVEKGERPLRLLEARALAGVLGVDVADFLTPMDDSPELVLLRRALYDAADAWRASIRSRTTLMLALEQLDRATAAAETAGVSSAALDEARALLSERDLDEIDAEGDREARLLGIVRAATPESYREMRDRGQR